MDRRQHLLSLGAIGAHALFPGILTRFVDSVSGDLELAYDPQFFSDAELQFVAGLIDIILPATKSKSASEVNTHLFLDEVFANCIPEQRKSDIKEGLGALMARWPSVADKHEEVVNIDRAAFAGEADWFLAIKQYTLIGFFTSQEGVTVASDYVKVPGDFKGAVKADETTLNHAMTNLRYYL